MTLCFLNETRICNNECSMYESSGFQRACHFARTLEIVEVMCKTVKEEVKSISSISSQLKKISNAIENIKKEV